MATKTYFPQLVKIAKLIVAYVERYRQKIENGLNPTGIALLNALIEAANALIFFLEYGDYPADAWRDPGV